MKYIVENIKGIAFLAKPVWESGKSLVLLSLFNAMILQPILMLIELLLTQSMINGIISKNDWSEILLTAFAFFSLEISIIFIQRTIDFLYNQEKTAEIQAVISKKIYMQSIKSDYKYFDDPEFYNSFTWAVNEFPRQAIQAVNFIISFCNAIATIIFMTIYISILSPLIILFIIMCIVTSTSINIYQNKLDMSRREELIHQDRKMSYLRRTFYLNNNAADLRITNVKDFLFSVHDRVVGEKKKIYKRYCFKLCKWSWIHNTIFKINDCVIVVYTAYGILRGRISDVGSYASLVTASSKLSGALFNLFSHITQANQLNLYAKKIQTFFELRSEIENKTHENTCHISNEPFSVEIKNVSFSYQDSRIVLKNLSMKIAKGEKIAIVGENGAGKSTIIKLLLGLYSADTGEILFDGKSIWEYDINKLRKKIGAALQNTNLYALSIADNLQIYSRADDSNLIDALETVKLGYLLKRENITLETEVTREFNKEGVIFSGGEIQKIGLARLINGNYGLLLLDEPSSSLDPLAEYELNKLLLDRSRETTTIIISHRLSTIKSVDRIYVIEDGVVKETGNHDELMNYKGKYYNMFVKQAENYL